MANKNGWWKITATNSDDDEEIELTDCDYDHIAEQIKEGYSEGEIVKDESEEEEVKEHV